MTRRTFLQHSFFAAAATAIGPLPLGTGAKRPIYRRALVERHNVTRKTINRRSPLQVGNGRFAFGVDLTGLQTFVPFNTMSEWAWYHAPLPAGQTEADYQPPQFDMPMKPHRNWAPDPQHPEISHWLYANPSKINLGRIGLTLIKDDGSLATEQDLQNPSQTLDLWTGIIRSTFTFEGNPIHVTTACQPDRDAIAVRVEGKGTGVFLEFPAPDGREFCDYVGTMVGAAPMHVLQESPNALRLKHDLGPDSYFVGVLGHGGRVVALQPTPEIRVSSARYGAGDEWADVTSMVAEKAEQGLVVGNSTLGPDPARNRVKVLEVKYSVGGRERQASIPENGFWMPQELLNAKRFHIEGTGDTLEVVVCFAKEEREIDHLPRAADVFARSAKAWPAFWETGGAVDLSESQDPRWKELERRIVLSQYLMAVNEAGDLPPQESGLVNNGWHGKYHMEMVWWHAAHYALWNRWTPYDRVTTIYERMLPSAKAVAKQGDYEGARWTKMTGPEFRNSPHICNAMLAWQQPHPMFFAELEYRARPTRKTLDKWRSVLEETAEFMASYVWPENGRFNIGPPLAVVSELNDYFVTKNPAFELTYWHMGLRIAQTWRERMKQPRKPEWDKILENLAPLPTQDGVYVMYEGVPDMWTQYNHGHPEECGIYGWLPGDRVDIETMRRTLAKTESTWRWDDTWGWDFPLLAMCAARLGQPEKAVDHLLEHGDAFGFDDAGLATGGPYPYFPSNGGLLYAVALMAAGWDGSPAGEHAPGFPKDKWVVRYEGLRPAL